MKSFLTGSHAYGTPKDSSDIDLVILCDEATKAKLKELSGGSQIRFGKLQIIAFTSEHVFDAWQSATNDLIARKPVSRNDAIHHIRSKCGEVLDSIYAGT